MKIPKENQEHLRALLTSNARAIRGGELAFSTLNSFVDRFRREVEAGRIPIQKCEAVNCFSRLLKGDALIYVCDVIYDELGCHDTHLHTFFRKLYKSL